MSAVTARSWKLDEWISANCGVFSSLIRCSVAMLATNPMPGRPSIRMGSLRVGFSSSWIVQVIVGFLWEKDGVFVVWFLILFGLLKHLLAGCGLFWVVTVKFWLWCILKGLVSLVW